MFIHVSIPIYPVGHRKVIYGLSAEITVRYGTIFVLSLFLSPPRGQFRRHLHLFFHRDVRDSVPPTVMSPNFFSIEKSSWCVAVRAGHGALASTSGGEGARGPTGRWRGEEAKRPQKRRTRFSHTTTTLRARLRSFFRCRLRKGTSRVKLEKRCMPIRGTNVSNCPPRNWSWLWKNERTVGGS